MKMGSRRWATRLLAAVVLALGLCLPGQAAEENEDKTTVVKTRDGLKFKVLTDWPIEKRNGVVAPIPIEEYLSKKFAAFQKRLHATEEQVASLEFRMRALEEELKKPKKLEMPADTPP